MAMRRTTGIELRPDSCLLVAAARRGEAIEVATVHAIPASDWPAHDTAVTSILRNARRERRLPRRATVVAWGLPETADAAEVTTRAALRPVTDAGFRVARALTPAAALVLMAASRPRSSSGAAIAWLLLNRHGAAIAIVRDGDLLFSRTFDWHYDERASSPKAQLLRRYTLVAHLAPEVQHGVAEVRAAHGVEVDTLVTCGDLPELRSLAMPLIEELGLEVETLDSTEGLRAIGSVTETELAEQAPAIRIAIAGAVAGAAAQPVSRVAVLVRAAAVLGALGLVGWGLYVLQPWRAPGAPAATVPGSPVDAPDRGGVPTTGRVTEPVARPGQPQRPSVVSPGEGSPARDSRPGATGVAPLPPAGPAPPTAPAVPAASPSATPGVEKPAPDEDRATVPALSAPLPRLDSILIDHDRRLAVIGGAIVRVGDAVGPRVVVDIQPTSIVLREPSGRRVVVRLGPG
jgi:hypothetical protein